MIDLVIISVPGTITRTPPAAPALLKASVEKAGFTCKTIDFNIRFYHESVDHDAMETYFSTNLNTDQETIARQLIKKWTDEIVSLKPKYVGISVFTYQNRIATRMFCEELKKYKDIKIILGGQGLGDGGIAGSIGFGKLMIDNKLADYWIRSEGEISLVELLKNNILHPGINSEKFTQINDLDSLPFPDYSDYHFDQYDRHVLPITGSRGCVRSCSFCDVHEHWKYRYRTGESIANEMLHLANQYNIYDFSFSDSLINGNLKEFKLFIKILADYNKSAKQKISWTSQFIIRSQKEVTEQYWQDIADSGAQILAIGVETGSDLVRTHMNKKFTNQDLDYNLKMMEKYNIKCVFLIIIGYPTETEKDFQDTLNMFTKYQHLANKIIVDVNIGSTLAILPGTDLYKNSSEYHIEIDKFENNWIAHDNPDLTIERRLSRRQELHKHLVDLGYILSRDSTEHALQLIESMLDLYNQRLKVKKLIKIKNANSQSTI